MKKLLIASAIIAASTQTSALTYNLGYAGLDVPFNPPGYVPFTEFSASAWTASGPTNTTTISFGNVGTPNPGNFQYSADWTMYMASGALIANNVSCVSLDAGDFCGSGALGDLVNNGGFVSPVTFLETSGVPVNASTTSDFDLFFTTISNGGNEYDYKFTWTTVPVPAAAWLFGSALVGLAGIKRKRQ